MLVDVGVQVDQPRRDDLVRGVEHAASLRVRDVFGDSGDPTVQDRDVAYRGQILPRVLDHPAARNPRRRGVGRGLRDRGGRSRRPLREERRAAGCAGAEVPSILSTSLNALISACRRSISLGCGSSS